MSHIPKVPAYEIATVNFQRAADLHEARLSSVDRALVDARIAHCEHLRDTRGVVV